MSTTCSTNPLRLFSRQQEWPETGLMQEESSTITRKPSLFGLTRKITWGWGIAQHLPHKLIQTRALTQIEYIYLYKKVRPYVSSNVNSAMKTNSPSETDSAQPNHSFIHCSAVWFSDHLNAKRWKPKRGVREVVSRSAEHRKERVGRRLGVSVQRPSRIHRNLPIQLGNRNACRSPHPSTLLVAALQIWRLAGEAPSSKERSRWRRQSSNRMHLWRFQRRQVHRLNQTELVSDCIEIWKE